MKKVRESDKGISGVNVIPIIDVSLFLVIIMLVTAPIMNIPNIPVNLPEAATTEAKESNITVSLASDGRLSVDEKIVSLEELPAAVNAKLGKKKDTMVIIRADKDLYYSQIEDTIDLLKRRTRAKRISVATKQKESKPAVVTAKTPAPAAAAPVKGK